MRNADLKTLKITKLFPTTTERDGTEWEGRGWDKAGRDATTRDATGRDTSPTSAGRLPSTSSTGITLGKSYALMSAG